jgi:hypothetical protein
VPHLESGGTDGKVYRTAGIPTFASSGLFEKPAEMYAHGLNERLPVVAFYEGLDHIHRLAVELGGAQRALEKLEGSNEDQAIGIKILSRSIEEPLRQIVATGARHRRYAGRGHQACDQMLARLPWVQWR